VTSFFVTGPESETLPIYIWGQLRFGVTPAINATAAMILGLTLVAIVLAYAVLRRTSQTRDGAWLPGV
jgi:spermidine/putrescine transport system permease protein